MADRFNKRKWTALLIRGLLFAEACAFLWPVAADSPSEFVGACAFAALILAFPTVVIAYANANSCTC